MVHRSNGFDWLRLVAATAVIWGHAYPLTGHVSPGVLSNGVQTIGVKIFFVISGFLITKSWQSDPNVLRFASKRLLRIMPGLAAVCLITVFVLGPMFTSLPLSTYFANPTTYRYFWNIALYPVYALPGVFDTNVYGAAINGSLWSLPVEIAMYVGVPILAASERDVARIALPLCAILLLCAGVTLVRITPLTPVPVFWGSSIVSALDTAFYFYAGATMAAWRLERCGHVAASMFLLVVAAMTINHTVLGEVALALLLPFAVISVGFRHFVTGERLIAHRDYSYGLYLYGFPIQQAVVHLRGPTSAFENAVIAFPITLVFAALSWHLLESRVLASKPSRSATTMQPLAPALTALL